MITTGCDKKPTDSTRFRTADDLMTENELIRLGVGTHETANLEKVNIREWWLVYLKSGRLNELPREKSTPGFHDTGRRSEAARAA